MILSRSHFQVIMTHGDTPVPHRSPTVTSRTAREGGDAEGRECHDDGLWITPAKIGNGTVMGR